MTFRAVLIWLALMLVVFAVVESWLGNGLGEMQNYLLAAIVLVLASREFK